MTTLIDALGGFLFCDAPSEAVGDLIKNTLPRAIHGSWEQLYSDALDLAVSTCNPALAREARSEPGAINSLRGILLQDLHIERDQHGWGWQAGEFAQAVGTALAEREALGSLGFGHSCKVYVEFVQELALNARALFKQAVTANAVTCTQAIASASEPDGELAIEGVWYLHEKFGLLLPATVWPAALIEALQEACHIADPTCQGRLLALTAQLPEPGKRAVLRRALIAARQVRDDWTKAHALIALAPYLPADTLGEALDTATGIQLEGARARVLAALAPALPEPQRSATLCGALRAAQLTADEWTRSRALVALAPQLPGALLTEALGAARSIVDGKWRAPALSALAQRAPAAETYAAWREALETTLLIKDEYVRSRELVYLAPRLPEALLGDALEGARHVRAGYLRSSVLEALAPHLPNALLDQALDIARHTSGSSSRAVALAALAPHLPAEDKRAAAAEANLAAYAGALTEARAMYDFGARAAELIRLAPILPEALLGDALHVALTIRPPGPRAGALTALGPRLAEPLRAQALDEALKAAGQMRGARSRAEALAALVPHLPADRLGQALDAAKSITSPRQRAIALTALVPQLPGTERRTALSEALGAARAIRDARQKEEALANLAPHLSEESKREVSQA